MEEWRTVEAYNVEVSRDGRVRRGCKVFKPGLFNGYPRVEIARNKRVFIHRLVALAFCLKPEGCDVVDHLDGNKLNFAPENLEWTTQAENARRYNAARYGKAEFPPDDASVQQPALEALIASLAGVFGELPDFSGIADEELAA